MPTPAPDRRGIWNLVRGGKPAETAARITLEFRVPRVGQRMAVPYAKVSFILFDADDGFIQIVAGDQGSFFVRGRRLLALYEKLLTHTLDCISESDARAEDESLPFVENITLVIPKDTTPSAPAAGSSEA